VDAVFPAVGQQAGDERSNFSGTQDQDGMHMCNYTLIVRQKDYLTEPTRP
jgi:hypothetical protein